MKIKVILDGKEIKKESDPKEISLDEAIDLLSEEGLRREVLISEIQEHAENLSKIGDCPIHSFKEDSFVLIEGKSNSGGGNISIKAINFCCEDHAKQFVK